MILDDQSTRKSNERPICGMTKKTLVQSDTLLVINTTPLKALPTMALPTKTRVRTNVSAHGAY